MKLEDLFHQDPPYYRIYSINSRAYYSNSSGKIRVREFIRMRVLLNGVC